MENEVNIDDQKVDDAILALLYLNQLRTGCAWKQFDWESTNRLHEADLISDPKNKNKSVTLSDAGISRAESLLSDLFSR